MKHENKNAKRKLPGFYIALCCCVLLIGIAGYFTETHTERSETVINTEITETDSEPVFSNELTSRTEAAVATLPPVIEVTEAPLENAAFEETNSDEDETAQAEPEPAGYEIDNPDFAEDAITVSAREPEFTAPVNGDILERFSETLSYNHALDDWRAHSGIDIAADKGCSVQSAATGVVDKIYDNAMGTCVEISHSGGFVTRYMGLENAEDITAGREIGQGEVIGIVGDCKGENVTQPHLHFEMEKNGEAVNPSDYLPD